MQHSVVVYIFFVCDWKYPFWANSIQKIKIVGLNRNLVVSLIQICRIQCDVHFFSFKSKIPFLGEYKEFNGCGHFSIFNKKHPFLVNLVNKMKILV